MICAIIPARGGSKSIPLKNIVEVNGRPLIWWVLDAANNSMIDKIYVSTDSKEINNVVESFKLSKVNVIGRSDETSTDNTPTEFVIDEFIGKYDFQDLVLIQPTSPLLKKEHINNCIKKYKKGNYDSLLSLVRQHNFQWKLNNDDCCEPLYDIKNRPRRQEYGGYFIENGAFYITKKEIYLKNRVRVSGRIGYYELPPYTYYEVDEIDDIPIINELLKKHK
jgi:N-acylneuraminate cytidylyltransferase